MPNKADPRPRKRGRNSAPMTVRLVPPGKPPTPEQIAEAHEALLKFVRALARMAAQKDFEQELQQQSENRRRRSVKTLTTLDAFLAEEGTLDEMQAAACGTLAKDRRRPSDSRHDADDRASGPRGARKARRRPTTQPR